MKYHCLELFAQDGVCKPNKEVCLNLALQSLLIRRDSQWKFLLIQLIFPFPAVSHM